MTPGMYLLHTVESSEWQAATVAQCCWLSALVSVPVHVTHLMDAARAALAAAGGGRACNQGWQQRWRQGLQSGVAAAAAAAVMFNSSSMRLAVPSV